MAELPPLDQIAGLAAETIDARFKALMDSSWTPMLHIDWTDEEGSQRLMTAMIHRGDELLARADSDGFLHGIVDDLVRAGELQGVQRVVLVHAVGRLIIARDLVTGEVAERGF